MKNYVVIASLICAALFGYSVHLQSKKHHAIEHKVDAQEEARQKQIKEQEEKQAAAIETKARELTKATLITLNYDTANGEKCTENCQDANAGYEWAKSQDFNEESDCGGKTEAYQDGCQVYVDKYNNLLDENKEKLEASSENNTNTAQITQEEKKAAIDKAEKYISQ